MHIRRLVARGTAPVAGSTYKGAPWHRRLTAFAAGSLIAGFMAVPVLAPLTALSSQPAGAANAHHATAHSVPHLTPHSTPQVTSPANAAHNAPHLQRPLLGAAPHLAAAAATFTVNTTADTHDATPGDGICADSGGACSLRATIEEANADGLANPAMGTTDVVVPAGTYTLSLGSSLTASDPAGLDISGAGAGSTVIQQMASPTAGVLIVAEATSTLGANVMLSGATIQGGSAGDSGGGGIAVNDTNDLLQLVGVTVTGNSAGFGAGVYNDGELWATNSSLGSNAADDSDDEPTGGGLYNDNGASLTNTTVNNNTANSTAPSPGNEAFGGGIYNDGSLLVEGGTISGNSVGSPDNFVGGGGLYVDDTTDLSGVTIDSNSATTGNSEDAYGGGIYADFGLDSITNSSISGNVATGLFANGGGIDIDEGGPTITGSTLDNNQANGGGDGAYGGAISTYESGGSATVSNSTLSGNSATDATDGGYGGAIMAYEYGSVAVSGSTLDNNTASGTHSEGGALWSYSDDPYYGTSVTGSTLSSNTVNGADGEGGAVWDENYSTTFTNDTVTQNQVIGSDAGGGGLLPRRRGRSDGHHRHEQHRREQRIFRGWDLYGRPARY